MVEFDDLGCKDTGTKTLTDLKGSKDMINALSEKQNGISMILSFELNFEDTNF